MFIELWRGRGRGGSFLNQTSIQMRHRPNSIVRHQRNAYTKTISNGSIVITSLYPNSQRLLQSSFRMRHRAGYLGGSSNSVSVFTGVSRSFQQNTWIMLLSKPKLFSFVMVIQFNSPCQMHDSLPSHHARFTSLCHTAQLTMLDSRLLTTSPCQIHVYLPPRHARFTSPYHLIMLDSRLFTTSS